MAAQPSQTDVVVVVYAKKKKFSMRKRSGKEHLPAMLKLLDSS